MLIYPIRIFRFLCDPGFVCVCVWALELQSEENMRRNAMMGFRVVFVTQFLGCLFYHHLFGARKLAAMSARL